MDIQNLYDYGNNDGAITECVGAAIYEDEPFAQSDASAVNNQINHGPMLGGNHGTGFADLLSPLYDVDRMPGDSDYGSEEAPVFRDESTPWHSGWACGVPDGDIQPNTWLSSPSQTHLAGRLAPHKEPCLPYHAERFDGKQDAHSSTDGISQWPDLAMNDDPTKGFRERRPEDSTSFAASSSGGWSANDKLLQELSPATSVSQWGTPAGAIHGQGTANKSSTSSYVGLARSMRRKRTSIRKPSEAIALKEPPTQATAGQSDGVGAARPHVCSSPSCDANFATRSGVKHHENTHNAAKKNANRCPDCEFGCRYPKDMKRHLKTHNKEREMFPCTEAGCPRSYTREEYVARHVSKKHNSTS